MQIGKLNCQRTICQSMMAWLMERRFDSFRIQGAVLLLSENVKCGMNKTKVILVCLMYGTIKKCSLAMVQID